MQHNGSVHEFQGVMFAEEKKAEMYEDVTRSLDLVTINSVSINRLRCIIMTKLITDRKHVRCKIANKVDTFCDSKLVPVELYRKLFPKTSREQVRLSIDMCIESQTCNRTCTMQLGHAKCKFNIKSNLKYANSF